MNIGQGAGIFYQPKDKVGGGENLEQTLVIGNTTNGNDIVVSVGDLISFLNSTFGLSINTETLTANHVVQFQNKSGLVALISDIVAKSLEETLVVGKLTGANEIDHNKDGSIIKGGTTTFLDISLDSANKNFLLTTDNGAYSLGFLEFYDSEIYFGNNSPTGGYVALDMVAGTTADKESSVVLFANTNFLQSKWNVTGNFISGGSDKPSTIISVNNGTIQPLIRNSVVAGGTGVIADKNDYCFVHNFEIQNGVARYNSTPAMANDLDLLYKKFIENYITTQSFQEKAGTVFVNPTVSTWETIVVPGATANSTVQIAMQNTSASGQTAGVRKVGSALNRVMTAKGMANFVTVLTDASSQIQIYSGDLTAIQFRLWGEFPTV